jgi:hypothetical protein
MMPLRFDKMTKKIGLVLISSSLILGGCSAPCEDAPKDEQAPPGQRPPGCHGGRGGHGHAVPMGGHPVIVPLAGGAAARAAPAAGSARGGFGATGHAAGAGE